MTREWRLIEPVTETADGQPLPDFRGRPRDPAPLLFHRPSDPREERNVAADYPEVVTALRAEIAARLERCAAFTGVADPFRCCRPSLLYPAMLERFERRHRRL